MLQFRKYIEYSLFKDQVKDKSKNLFPFHNLLNLLPKILEMTIKHNKSKLIILTFVIILQL